MSTTLYDKIWNDHLVDQQDDGTALLFVDRHLVHEVTSPQAFEGLRNSNRKVRHPNLTLAVADHNVPTTDRSKGISDEESKIQVDTLEANCKEFGVQLFGMDDKRQGIVHIIGPEQGFTQPGTVIVCGDSHTATHGAFGSLAFGIGTSEVEHVLATQTLVQKKAKNFRINVNGQLPLGVTSKDVILQIIGKIGTAGGTGSVIEYAGDLIRSLSVEQRMTICNMTIEGGARAGLIAPDEKIFNYLKGKPMSPQGDNWEKALNYWNTLKTDEDASFDQELNLNANEILPMITWGTSPQDVITIDDKVPNPQSESDEDKKNSIERALKYMGLKPDMAAKDIKIDKVFIGSCTNGRIEDLREAAKILKDKKISSHVNAMVVPGSGLVKEQAEQEGLDKIFVNSGFEWREPGCSMCLAMNADKLKPEERCASTSNRNFEGRQGRGGRTHLVSPGMAAAAAIPGLTRWVLPPLPCLPSKFRFDVEAHLSSGFNLSAFIAKHIEQPGSLHSNPELTKILSSPSCSACSLTKPEPGTTMALTCDDTFLSFTIFAASLKSSILPLVQLPINTLSIFISVAAMSGFKPIYFKALSIEFFLSSSVSLFGFGTFPSIVITSCGDVPHVIMGKISFALRLISLSKLASASVFKVSQ